MEKEAKKATPITEEICRKLELMMRGGADGVEAARLVGISQSRASRIKRAGFSYEKYRENDQKEREGQKRKTEQEPEAEEQVPGQMEMDLQPAEEQKPEMSEQVKMMRFQAAQTEKIIGSIQAAAEKIMENNTGSMIMLRTKLDQLNDTLCMILRMMRKE